MLTRIVFFKLVSVPDRCLFIYLILSVSLFARVFEPHRYKTNKMTSASSEGSYKPRRPPSLIRIFACAHWIAKDPMFLHADSED